MENKRQKLELSDILTKHADVFLKEKKMVPVQYKAFRDIASCRTESMGGHAKSCDHCGYKQFSYNSCRNRHCPKCQYLKQVQWVEKLKSNLFDCPYYHIVFTLPKSLHKAIYINQSSAYALMFKAASQALKQCIGNPNFIGAQYGAVGILHTWGQNLSYHPHIHMMVPAGGLSTDEMEWVPAGKSFFVPVNVLTKLYRAIFCRLFFKEVGNKSIVLPEAELSANDLKQKLFSQRWHVYIQKPFNTAKHVVDYLGKYTHRVAISNQRLIADQDGKIIFKYKDYRDGGIQKVIKLEVGEFLNRFSRHILPSGFYKIRYFGILSLANSTTKRALCYEFLGKVCYFPTLEGLPYWDILNLITKTDPSCCPICKTGRMLLSGLSPISSG